MMKKLMFCATMVAALFTSCSSEDEMTNNGVESSNARTLVIMADLGEDTRLGFIPDGNALKASFQEGDEIVYWTRKSATSGTGGPYRLYYKGMENGKGKFVGQVDGDDFLPETNNLHMLLSNGFTFNGNSLQAFDLSQQDGTLASAAKYSAYQCDFYFDENNKKVEGGVITLTGVKFSPKTAVVKFTLTKPDNLDITTETPITVTTQDVYSKVSIGWGVPGNGSLPAKDGTGEATFTLKPGEINGNTITSYLTVWPSASENALTETRFDITEGIKSYQATVMRDNPTALTAGKVYRAKSAAIEYTGAVKQVVWIKDAAGVAVDNLTGYSAGTTASADWLSIEGGKISATENTTGAPRTGTIYVKDNNGDEIPYEVTQVEPKDFKGSWSFTTKIFQGTGYYKATADPATFDVEFVDARKGYTLTDADGETQHINNIGIKGLYHDAIMDAAIEIDYKNHTAKMGVFYDARDGEGQEVTGGKYMTFVPALVTMVPGAAWGKSWKFDETELGDPDYTWAWFTISSDLKTILYANVTNNKTQSFSTVSQYTAKSTDTASAGEPMNNIAGIDIVLSGSNVFTHSTVSGYANVYQTNPKGYTGNTFTRK